MLFKKVEGRAILSPHFQGQPAAGSDSALLFFLITSPARPLKTFEFETPGPRVRKSGPVHLKFEHAHTSPGVPEGADSDSEGQARPGGPVSDKLLEDAGLWASEWQSLGPHTWAWPRTFRGP